MASDAPDPQARVRKPGLQMPKIQALVWGFASTGHLLAWMVAQTYQAIDFTSEPSSKIRNLQTLHKLTT